MSHDLRSGSGGRERTGGRDDARTGRPAVWWLLPSQRAIRRLTIRLLGIGLACLAVGLPGLVRLAARGSVSGLRVGLLAVGYACLSLVVTVPAVYWMAILGVGLGTLLGRRLRAVWHGVRTVDQERVADPDGSLRL